MKKNIKIAIGQMNSVVGDFAGNTRKMISWIRKAEAKKADLIVFPELALSGYPVWDLANKKRFVDENLKCLDRIIKATKGKRISVLTGFIDKSEDKKGEWHSHNAMAFVKGGKLRGTQWKRLLPTYDVFLEDIFYKPGKKSQLFEANGLKIGPTICEDIWDDGYDDKPLEDLSRKRPDLFVNVSSSPYYRGVGASRDQLLQKHARKYKKPQLYVNLVGGQDDLIFDGRSLFVDAKGRVLFRAPAFKEGLFYFDWKTKESKPYEVPSFESEATPAEVYEALVLGVRDYFQKNGFNKALIGLSGGIDSTLVAAIAIDALGKKAVSGVTMPSAFSSKGSWQDSEELAKRLGIDFRVHPIREKYDFMIKQYWKHYRDEKRAVPKKGQITLSMENLQARLRGLELMFLSNHEGRLLLTTGNKSELAMGYCTLYGDMAGGLCVLGDVYKTDVYRLSWYCNLDKEIIPREILEKPPSAELRPNQKDEDSLPAYEVLDEILYLYIEQNRSREEIIQHFKARGSSIKQLIVDTIKKVDHNEYKRRQTPPLLRVTDKAWFGRRMPITNRFES